MRNFIISTSCLLVLIFAWCCFHFYSFQETNALQSQLDTIISEQIPVAQWNQAEETIAHFSQNWASFKKSASYFLEEEALNDIDCAIEQSYYYIHMKEPTTAIGELIFLKDAVDRLYQTEQLIPENIF